MTEFDYNSCAIPNELLGFPGISADKVSICNAGDPGSIPGLERSPGGRHGNPLQYSCLENPMDRGAWRATAHKVTKSWTQLRTATAKSLQSCPSLCDPIDSSSPTGVGCHFLLQCMKVKNESEVAQSCLTLSDPMDCSLPGSSVHGIFQARVLEWGDIAFSDN